jgi:hypothetical protein
MDDFGFFTWSATGAPELSPASFTMRVVYSAILTPRNWGSSKYVDIAVPGITPSNAAAFVLPSGDPQPNLNAQLEPDIFEGFVRVWRTIKNDPYGNSGVTITTQRVVVVRTS